MTDRLEEGAELPTGGEIEREVEEYKRLGEKMEDFELQGAGNAVERLANEPPEVQRLSAAYRESQEEYYDLKYERDELVKDRIRHFQEVRQFPQDDLLGVLESAAKAHGPDKNMFSEEDKARLDELNGRMQELQSKMDSLIEKIRAQKELA